MLFEIFFFSIFSTLKRNGDFCFATYNSFHTDLKKISNNETQINMYIYSHLLFF